MTTRIQFAHGQMVRVLCVDCGHEGSLDLHKLMAREFGDLPLQHLRYRCKATRLVPDGPGLFTCGGTRARFIIQPHWEHRQK
jgi:hypothetical protein